MTDPSGAISPQGGRRHGGPDLKKVKHYLPVVVGLVVFAVIMVFLPTVEPSAVSNDALSGVAATIKYPAGDSPGDTGTAASGVKCAPNVRQVTWSDYAPYCQPVFPAGDSNGGATAPGVTSKTITMTFRYAITPSEQALVSDYAGGTFGTYNQEVEAVNDFVKVFNENFDLYGRKVVLKPFQGQGDILAEFEGTGQEAAQEDAATAKSLGAFADLSSFNDTPPYIEALSALKVISIGGLFDSAKYLDENSPYEYTQGPDCEKVAEISTAVVGRELQGLPAIFAGQGSIRAQKRTFGLATPDNPMYVQCGQDEVNDLKKQYGITVNPVQHYSLDPTTGADELANMIAKFKAAGDTTILCGCDPITPAEYTADADQQDYRPEWISIPYGNAFARIATTSQETDDISPDATPAVVNATAESNIALQMSGDPNASSLPPALVQGAYEDLLLFFDSLQTAGPDLDPQTFATGMSSMPTSGTEQDSEYGVWQFTPGMVDPSSSFQIMKWDPTAIAPDDGKPGSFVACNSGAVYLDSNAISVLPKGQIKCPPGS